MGNGGNLSELRERRDDDGDQARWRRVYAAVIIFAVLVVLLLWAFSRAYTPG